MSIAALGKTLPIVLLFLPCAARAGDWPSYGADPANSKYAPYTQIDRANFASLQVAWRWSLPSPHHGFTWLNQATPLCIDGVLYTSTPTNQIAAIDGQTGTTLWSFDPESYTQADLYTHRGVAYWAEGDDRRVIFGTQDGYLIALNAASGKPVPTFGQDGRVDLTQGLGRPIERGQYAVRTPPLICRDRIIVGSSLPDYQVQGESPPSPTPPGHVRAFDVRTGALSWTFHTIPQPGQFGHDTWEEDSWEETGNTNVWAVMSADPELGYIYLPVSTPTNDFYGGQRPGANLFAESIVCLKADSGERVWHFQLLHHGLWDYDLPAAPNLIDVTHEGRPVKAVAQITKQGFCFVFDRVSGRPLWPIAELPVPASKVAGESAWPTQPVPSKPAPFERQGLSQDDFIDFTPQLRAEALHLAAAYDYGPLYTPPTERGLLVSPGQQGGASWAGAAVDPQRGLIYIPSITHPMPVWLHRSFGFWAPYDYYGEMRNYLAGPQGLPFTKPPYGRITAIDLNSGQQRWVSPVGEGPRHHSALRHLDLPHLGWNRRIFPLLTPTLLLAGQEGRRWEEGGRSWPPQLIDEPYLWAFDPANGTLLGRVELPGNANGAPITYTIGGKQYLAVPIGGGPQTAELIALTLP
ncbi:MAG: PQQ-binding-like beta-propeller repeat protein [Candidatus Latescibacteria bacterium]|nr:PQQ-binding-like beta-propeller repeat protein [Candidatus Latescibacterota bacterium]